MGIYNVLTCETECPHCGYIGEVEAETKNGFLNLLEHRIGDSMTWTRKVSLKKGGRPRDGNMDGEGYAVCPSCDRDYFLVVEIRDDRITAVRVDHSKPGFMEQGEKIHGTTHDREQPR